MLSLDGQGTSLLLQEVFDRSLSEEERKHRERWHQAKKNRHSNKYDSTEHNSHPRELFRFLFCSFKTKPRVVAFKLRVLTAVFDQRVQHTQRTETTAIIFTRQHRKQSITTAKAEGRVSVNTTRGVCYSEEKSSNHTFSDQPRLHLLAPLPNRSLRRHALTENLRSSSRWKVFLASDSAQRMLFCKGINFYFVSLHCTISVRL